MQCGELRDERETDAGPGARVVVVATVEGSEDELEVLGIDTGSAVLDLDAAPLAG
jgi:hypothetical protein